MSKTIIIHYCHVFKQLLTFMNMTIHVILGLDPILNTVQEVNTARPHPGAGQVAKAQGWTVSNQDIRIVRYQVPFVQTRLSPLQIECPASKLRLPRGSC